MGLQDKAGESLVTDFATIQEIVLKAFREMDPRLWDFVSGGSESETTLRRNRQALDRLALRPRVLRDVTKVDPSSTVLGCKSRIPVFLAPIGAMEQMHQDGAMACLCAAREFGVPFFLSSVNSVQLEEAALAAGEILFFQLYVLGDNDWLGAYLTRVADVRCQGFCLTVDTAVYSRRERDLMSGYRPPGRVDKSGGGPLHQAAMTWDFVDSVKKGLQVPMVLKGIATAEDARLAVEHGVELIYVSNHGGRQLDHGRGSIDVLPEIIQAVDGKAEVVVDGGFMRGSDVLKAIALGARAVGLGKLQAWALAAGGESGVRRMLEILEEEIRVSMGLLGITAMDQLDPAFLQAEIPVKFPSEFSPFPTLEKLLR
jgi:isopentenyl diphosphate isomerase/L-lactate dehydrogenase-like FMN-dependent dehydrogenase